MAACFLKDAKDCILGRATSDNEGGTIAWFPVNGAEVKSDTLGPVQFLTYIGPKEQNGGIE